MQKQAFLVHFTPLPAPTGDALFYDTAPVKLPYAETFSMLHYHDRYEIGLCEEGEGLFLSRGVISYVSKGDVIFVAPNELHYSRSFSPDTPCRCRFVFFDAETVDSFMNGLDNGKEALGDLLRSARERIPTVIRASDSPRMCVMLTELVNACKIGTPYLEAQTKLRLALFLFEAHHTLNEDPRRTADKRNPDPLITELAEYLSTNYNRHHSVEELAALCHLSESQLRRRFVRVYGLSPIAYRNKLRCKIAVELLRRTQLSISEISSRVGYSDISDFYRAFKKHYGAAPSVYRAKNQPDPIDRKA